MCEGIRSSLSRGKWRRRNQMIIAAKVTGPDRQQQLKLAPTFKFRLAISRWPSGCRLLWAPSHEPWLNKQTLQTCTNCAA